MSQSRPTKGYYINVDNIPIKTDKTVYFNWLKFRFPSILLNQTTENDEKNDCYTHHIVIQNESRVSFFKFNQLFMTWVIINIIARLNLIK